MSIPLRLSFVAAVAALSLVSGVARASSWYGAPFSADIVMINPVDPKDRATGKLFVGPDRFRAEGSYQGAKKVLLVNMTDQKAYTLLPEKRQFHEGLSEALMPPRPDVERMPGDPKGPCKTDPQLTCVHEGEEKINDIQTEKWTVKAGGKDDKKDEVYVVNLWVDTKRRIVVKQQPGTGPVMERKLLGVEKINGRETEKWEFSHSYKEQRNSYQQWIDVALRIPVRMGEGRQAAMEISNIREGAQDAALFQVPADFKQVEPPPPPSATPDQADPRQPPRAPGGDPKKGPKFQ